MYTERSLAKVVMLEKCSSWVGSNAVCTYIGIIGVVLFWDLDVIYSSLFGYRENWEIVKGEQGQSVALNDV